MRKFLKTMLLASVIAGAIISSNLACAAEKESVVIKDDGHTKVIIRTDADNAQRLRKILKNSDRVVIRTPYDNYYNNRNNDYYPRDYYPYYKDKGPAYSSGYAAGRLLSD